MGNPDSDWTAFVPLEETLQEYNAERRPAVQRLASGGTTYGVTQSSYDSRGRLECTATCMNAALYSSPPASACTQSTPSGSFGPDRITKRIYNAASQITQQQVAVGTSDQANEAIYTYSDNGLLSTLTDAEINKTTYEYDGQDRLVKTLMPLPTTGSGASNAVDYEELGYDANGM